MKYLYVAVTHLSPVLAMLLTFNNREQRFYYGHVYILGKGPANIGRGGRSEVISIL